MVRRWWAWIAALGLLVAACTVETVETTTTASPTTTTVPPTTTVAETTTTTVARTEVVPLRPRNPASQGSLQLQTGVRYLHDYSIPLELNFDRDGWAVDVVGERMVGFLNDEGERSLAVYVTFMTDSVEELLAFVQEDEKSVDVTDPVATTVAGLAAVTVDVLVPPGESPGFGELECWSEYAGPVWYVQMVEGIGYPSVLVGCAWNRVWVMDAEGASVVIHAGDVGGDPDEEPVELDGMEPLIEEFLAAITFNP